MRSLSVVLGVLVAGLGILRVLPVPATAHEIELTGTLRDFKRGDQSGGHLDFNTHASGAAGHHTGLVLLKLGEDNKPAYNPRRPAKDPFRSALTFRQWYTDVPGVNIGTTFNVKLSNNQQYAGGVYTYENNSFFPIDNQFFGNEGLQHNYGFTYEIHTTFSYMPGQKFSFTGDDDIWVFINKLLVIDLGGIHSKLAQSVLLFDGKAFVDDAAFKAHLEQNPTGPIKTVSAAQAEDLAFKWRVLELEGACPIKAGDIYVDLGLAVGGADTRAVFEGAKVKIFSTAELKSVKLTFVDGSEEDFADLDTLTKRATRIALSGTQVNQGKVIRGASVQVVSKPGAKPAEAQYFGASGAGGVESPLDFFFAERQCCSSNFRIDTSIVLADSPLTAKRPEPVQPVVAPPPPPPPTAVAPPPPPPVTTITPVAAPAPVVPTPPPTIGPAPAQSPWKAYLLAFVLLIGAAVAALMSSRRTHQD